MESDDGRGQAVPSPSVRGRGLKPPGSKIIVTQNGSPSVRGRGLKLAYNRAGNKGIGSPSVRGRGLKPDWVPEGYGTGESPSVRGRGLKREYRGVSCGYVTSPSVRGRGLKLIDYLNADDTPYVALRTRAWIETGIINAIYAEMLFRRPPYEGVD